MEVLGDTSDPCQVGQRPLESCMEVLGDTPSSPARRLRPLDSRIEVLGDTPRPLPEGSALWSPV